MRYLRPLLASIALIVVAPITATAVTFTDVYFFGASSNDTGNAGPGDLPEPNRTILTGTFGYDPNRWTNNGGTIWTEPFAADLGFSGASVASSEGGNNYAFSGSRADELSIQISDLSANKGGAVSSTALYSIWAGGNDFLQGQTAASTVTDIINAINSLSVLGAENFLILNFQDFSPLAPGTGPLAGIAPIPADADIWANDFNNGLASAIAGLSGVTVFEYDVASLLNAIITDPIGNGFPAGLAPCTLDANCINGIGTENFVMMDHIHFMSGTHDIIAAGALAAVPEPSTGLLLGLGLAVMGMRRTR